MNDRVCRDSDRLRNPERLARLEIGRVVDTCLAGPPVRSVLDVGTGTGVFAEAFAGRGLDVTGIDIQESMLEAARAAVPGVRFLRASSESLPFEDGAFDLLEDLQCHARVEPLRLQHVLRVVEVGVRVVSFADVVHGKGEGLGREPRS